MSVHRQVGPTADDSFMEPAAEARVVARFKSRTKASAELANRSRHVLPGGIVSLASDYAPYQVAFARASGPFLWDLDGHRYVDLHNRFTTLVHGHQYGPIVEAMDEVSHRLGPGPPAPAPEQVELADLLTRRIGSVDMIRFCNSGTEAGMLACQLARRITGRPRLLKARTGYHGWYEDLRVGRIVEEPDVTGAGARTLLADYGDAASFEATIDQWRGEIAAVILEPVLGAGGILGAPNEFFHRVRRAAAAAGAIFIADEVITLRLAEGGAQQLLEVEPDLTMMGKMIGGGLPVGALGGRGEFMTLLDPVTGPKMPHFGTFNGNPLTCAGGFAAVGELTQDRIDAMDQQALFLCHGIGQAATKLGIPCSITRAGSLLNVFFTDRTPSPPEVGIPRLPSRVFHLACLNHGIFMYPNV